jgi:hypothetical protein
MNFRLITLTVAFKKKKEVIPFTDFTCFFGKMGAGKSSIARLVDYCLGGGLEVTPALQNEFVAATLDLVVGENSLQLERAADSDRVRARWSVKGDAVEAMLPARSAAEKPIIAPDVFVLSDLIFHLAGRTPPKVRRSKLEEDSALQRLSFRDLYWYCYLDQDSLDSSFFNLEIDGNQWKRLKSLDVLRLLIGFHQEEVSELQVRLQETRIERDRAEGALFAMQDALDSTKIGSALQLAAKRAELTKAIAVQNAALTAVRANAASVRGHVLDQLRAKARTLAEEIATIETACGEADDAISKDVSHRNELESLSLRFKRASTASAVLRGVKFSSCPKCTQALPARAEGCCVVCGQAEAADLPPDASALQAVDADTKSRIQELDELVERQRAALVELRDERRELAQEKSRLDGEITQLSANYDSLYLANALETERLRASLMQELVDLDRFEQLTQRLDGLKGRIDTLIGEEAKLRARLKETQSKAERDTQNLERLKELFLDSLLRAKIPGFSSKDYVEMKAPNFLPEIGGISSGDLATTSFSNLGSGGKKTLFKCCFAVAVHRLAAETGGLLPSLLIIDSPMKNISERENIEQFQGFHEMLYALAQTELRGTQFVVIDKEIYQPPEKFERVFSSRHMTPNDTEFPPLISYYRGH